MNTIGEDWIFSTGWRTTVEKIRAPAGETQTFDPRPLPATWVVAVAVNPFGKLRRSRGFLVEVSQRLESKDHESNSLLQNSIGTGNDLRVHQVRSPFRCTLLHLGLVVTEISVKSVVVKVRRHLRRW